MVDWNGLLAQKYSIMQQQANADTSRAQSLGLTSTAGANLDTVRAGLLPGQTAADIGLTQAQAMAARANAANTNANTQYVGPLAMAQIGLQRAQGGYYGAGARNLASEASGNDILNQGSSFRNTYNQMRISRGLPPVASDDL